MRVVLFAAVCTALAGLILPAAADPILAPSSAPSETIGKAAAGEPKPYRAELVSQCDGAIQCILDFGRKRKTRTISLVNCVVGVRNGTALYSEIWLTDPNGDPTDPIAVVGYMGEISKAVADGTEIAIYEYPHQTVVPGGPNLKVVANASGAIGAFRCIVTGTIE